MVIEMYMVGDSSTTAWVCVAKFAIDDPEERKTLNQPLSRTLWRHYVGATGPVHAPPRA